MLFEFTFDKTNRQLCRVNGTFTVLRRNASPSDMVLMSVCNENTFELVGVALDICEIGMTRSTPSISLSGNARPRF